jgi:general secretion pathway protein D
MITVPVPISSVSNLFDYEFDLSFDPAILQLQSVTEGPFLSSGGGTTFFFPGFINNTTGKVTFVADTLIGPISGVSGAGVLADLQFQAISSGSSALTLSNVILQDTLGNDIPFTTATGQVTVLSAAAVPEPALLWPLGALLCLGFLLRLRESRSSPAQNRL